MSEQNKDDFYTNLKSQLEDTAMWPSEYLYKFIVPSKGNHFMEVEDILISLSLKIS